MRSILDIISGMFDEKPSVYKGFETADNNFANLESRVNALEARNLKYYAKVRRDSIQTIATGGAGALISYTQTLYPQIGNMWDIANPESIFIRRNGVYHLNAGLTWLATGVGANTQRLIAMLLIRSGVTYTIEVDLKWISAVGLSSITQKINTSHYLYEGDVIQVNAFQNSGGNVNIYAGSATDLYNNYIVVAERMEDLRPGELGVDGLAKQSPPEIYFR